MNSKNIKKTRLKKDRKKHSDTQNLGCFSGLFYKVIKLYSYLQKHVK